MLGGDETKSQAWLTAIQNDQFDWRDANGRVWLTSDQSTNEGKDFLNKLLASDMFGQSPEAREIFLRSLEEVAPNGIANGTQMLALRDALIENKLWDAVNKDGSMELLSADDAILQIIEGITRKVGMKQDPRNYTSIKRQITAADSGRAAPPQERAAHRLVTNPVVKEERAAAARIKQQQDIDKYNAAADEARAGSPTQSPSAPPQQPSDVIKGQAGIKVLNRFIPFANKIGPEGVRVAGPSASATVTPAPSATSAPATTTPFVAAPGMPPAAPVTAPATPAAAAPQFSRNDSETKRRA